MSTKFCYAYYVYDIYYTHYKKFLKPTCKTYYYLDSQNGCKVNPNIIRLTEKGANRNRITCEI